MILQLCIVLGALWLGSRYGSLALGAISGIGLAILVFGFGMKPGSPPTDVIYIIIAAVTCAGIMQASGGMDWLIQLAEKMLRKHPDRITFLAPLCTFFLTVLVGTGHVVYTLMPIICDIAIKKGIRPERPCGIASIASQIGITCSPIAAAVVAFITISGANGYNVSIPQVLMVTIPACLLGTLLGLFLCLFQFAVGKAIGHRFHRVVEAGQALGQKNTAFAIWMAYTFLNPLSSVGPGCYILWQNIINSYEIWQKRKKDGLRPS